MFAINDPLESLQIASPCFAPWEEMGGTDRVRFCRQCHLNVYNLSGMSRAEAEALVREREGRLCVRFFRRADGTMLTDDCPVGLHAVRAAGRIARRFVGAAAALLAVLLASSAGFMGRQEKGILRDSSLRKVEPFATFLQWLDPILPPSSPVYMGKMCEPPDRKPVQDQPEPP